MCRVFNCYLQIQKMSKPHYFFKESDAAVLQAVRAVDEEFNNRAFNYFKYVETGDITYLKKQMELLRIKDQSTDKSLKENIEPNSSILPKRSTRQNTNPSIFPQVNIKLEKLSIIPSTSKEASNLNVTRNEPQTDNMPAPTMLPPRKKKIKEECQEPVKRSTRTKAKKNYLEQPEVYQGKESDVIIQNTTVTMIDITDDSDNEKKNEKNIDLPVVNANETTRSTRTKTRRQKKQMEENAEMESRGDENNPLRTAKPSKRENKQTKAEETAERSKSLSPAEEKEENISAQTEYEDAVSNMDVNDGERTDIQSTTIVISASNKTMVVEKPTVVQNDVQKQEAQNNCKTPPRTKSKKDQVKEIFSPFDKTSLKKKVEAFEKLGNGNKMSSASKIPVLEDPGSELKTKPYTPFANKFLPKSCSTTRINRMTPTSQSSSNNDSCLSTKTLSALKASQAEYREREKRRQEKEQEAQLKKEALLQAQAEEKRRKREEKQLKAQQQRDLLQKEKEKLLEMQKLKQEKHKQVVAEKEERLQKSKEEAEKKRLLAKNKAKLAKQNESSDTKVAETGQTKRTKAQNHVPIYMLTKAPLLPTDDCYDSDDEAHDRKPLVRPPWTRDVTLKVALYAQMVAGDKMKNSMFCCQTHTPDLTEIFETIDPKKLKRTSSAVWRKPPRYTLFSMTSDIQFSEDSDD